MRDPRLDPLPGERFVRDPDTFPKGRWVQARDENGDVGWSRHRIVSGRRIVRWCSLKSWRRWAKDAQVVFQVDSMTEREREDELCANCKHPRHKHGDQEETFGCYSWATMKPLKVCDCEVFQDAKKDRRVVRRRRRRSS